jgi:hypothetical protein
MGNLNRRIAMQAQGIQGNPISKITRGKRAGGMAQAVEHLSSRHEALSSNPSRQEESQPYVTVNTIISKLGGP